MSSQVSVVLLFSVSGTASFSWIISLYSQGLLLLLSQLVVMKKIPSWRVSEDLA